jgi:hypothetical protein
METKSNYDQNQDGSKQTLTEAEIINNHIDKLLEELRKCYKALAENELNQQIKDFLISREDNKLLFSCHVRQEESHDAKEQLEDVPQSKAKNDKKAPSQHEQLRIPIPKKYYNNPDKLSDYKAPTDPTDSNYIPPEGLLIGTDMDGEPVYF